MARPFRGLSCSAMAGETVKCEAICLRIAPWSRTSHIVAWLTPHGIVHTSVKGAVRPKSAFLGQYDLNYTCEIVYYARAKGEIRSLRECSPLEMRDFLRLDHRLFALSDYFRAAVCDLAPAGSEAEEWFGLLGGALDSLGDASPSCGMVAFRLARLVDFEAKTLELAGLMPELGSDGASFSLRGERAIPVTSEIARCLRNPKGEKNIQILLDTARAIGVFYTFHLDNALETRRMVVKIICN